MNKTFEEMTVKELREEMGKRGLPKQKDGKKFTKPELVERLTKWYKEQEDIDADIQKAIEEAGQPEGIEMVNPLPDGYDEDDEAWDDSKTDNEEKTKEVVEAEKKDDYIVYAKTLEEIEQKYGRRKKQEIYDKELKVGSFVVFVHYVEAKSGEIYKKLRTAKVTGINRKKELVRVVTLLGTEKELSFDDLLYIKAIWEPCTYPHDIAMYLRRQRTGKGRALMYERLEEIDSNNQGQC